MEKKKTKKSAKKTTTKTPIKEAKVEEKVEAKVEEKIEVEEVVKEVKREEKKATLNTKKDHSLIKILLLSLLFAIVLTWIIPSGSFDGEKFVLAEKITRTGFNEIFLSVFYGANYYLVQLVLLAAIGIFYGVISKTKGYNKMINQIAKMWKGKEKAFILVNSLLITIMASCFTHPLATIVFIPMLFSVAKRLNLRKLSTVMMTFGSILIGLMGTTYGTYGIEYITTYLGTEATVLITARFGILALGYLLLNIFILFMEKKNAKAEVEEIFETEVEDIEGGHSVGYFIIFALLFVIMILGYVSWSTIFPEFKAFTDFHTWLTTEVTIGDHAIFGYILGNVTAFGTWDLFNICAILTFIALIVKFTSKIKWDEFFDRAINGLKKMTLPIALTTFAYAMFVICYWSGMTTTIINWINSTESFVPYLNALGNGIATFFHVDFGYTGFALGSLYAAKFADKVNQIMVIMTSMNGLVSFIAPTSVIMLMGLSMSNTSYKEWFKYIWKFVVVLLIILFIVYTII